MRAVNLIPSEQRSGASVGAGRSGGAAYAVLAVFGGLALMALLYGFARKDVNNGRSEVASITARSQQADNAAAQLAPYVSFNAMRQQRAQAVATLVDSRFDWAHAFHEFGRVLPHSATISSLSGSIVATGATATTSGVGSSPTPAAGTGTAAGAATGTAASPASAASTPVNSATPPGSVPTFVVAGCATSQAAVAETINRLRLIDGVSAVTLQTSSRAGGPGGGIGPGGCSSSDPVFTLTVTFQPLPTPATGAPVTAATVSVHATSAAGTTGGTR